MANKPAYIPTQVGGNNVTYVNGGYGYYSGGTWMMLTAQHMLITDMMIHSYAPHTYGISTTVHHNSGSVVVAVIFGLLGIIVIGSFIYLIIRDDRW